LHVLPFLTVK